MSIMTYKLGFWTSILLTFVFLVWVICFVGIAITSPLFYWTNFADYLYYQEIGELQNTYQTISEVRCVNNPYFRENRLKVFLCIHPKTNEQEIYAHLVREAKTDYRR